MRGAPRIRRVAVFPLDAERASDSPYFDTASSGGTVRYGLSGGHSKAILARQGSYTFSHLAGAPITLRLPFSLRIRESPIGRLKRRERRLRVAILNLLLTRIALQRIVSCFPGCRPSGASDAFDVAQFLL
jgi:hypothetical protein